MKTSFEFWLKYNIFAPLCEHGFLWTMGRRNRDLTERKNMCNDDGLIWAKCYGCWGPNPTAFKVFCLWPKHLCDVENLFECFVTTPGFHSFGCVSSTDFFFLFKAFHVSVWSSGFMDWWVHTMWNKQNVCAITRPTGVSIQQWRVIGVDKSTCRDGHGWLTQVNESVKRRRHRGSPKKKGIIPKTRDGINKWACMESSETKTFFFFLF